MHIIRLLVSHAVSYYV